MQQKNQDTDDEREAQRRFEAGVPMPVAPTPESTDGPNIPARELIRRLRNPSHKMLDAMAKAMSPAKRPTPDYLSVREKHRVRFVAAVEQMLTELGCEDEG